jgi:hypothetical protein
MESHRYADNRHPITFDLASLVRDLLYLLSHLSIGLHSIFRPGGVETTCFRDTILYNPAMPPRPQWDGSIIQERRHMESIQVERILEEYDELDTSTGDPELDAIQTALFIEDVLDIRLAEEEISPAVIGDRSALRNLVLRKLGGG